MTQALFERELGGYGIFRQDGGDPPLKSPSSLSRFFSAPLGRSVEFSGRSFERGFQR